MALARRPAPPRRICPEPGQFHSYAQTLQQLQELRAQLRELVQSGRRMAYIATARLQRGDFEGAEEVLQEIDGLAGAVGLQLGDDSFERLRLLESCDASSFLEVYIQTRSFQQFLTTGQLVPEIPAIWRTEISEYDNECLLLGLIASLRELERYAVNRGQVLDLSSVRLCLELGQGFEERLMQFNFRNSSLRQRFDGVKYSVKRLESLSYEICLARQRADMEPENEGQGGEESLDFEVFKDSQRIYEECDAKREQVMKRSRDVVKAAKNAIYALQRDDFGRADAQMQLCAEEANSIYAELARDSPSLRLGFFSGALEELAEALAYRSFRADGKLLTLEEMQALSGLDFDLFLSEYLGGIMDLTGEVGRLAIRSASSGRSGKEVIEGCLRCVEAVYDGISILPYLPGSLAKKMGTLKSTRNKIEQVLYELALLSR